MRPKIEIQTAENGFLVTKTVADGGSAIFVAPTVRRLNMLLQELIPGFTAPSIKEEITENARVIAEGLAYQSAFRESVQATIKEGYGELTQAVQVVCRAGADYAKDEKLEVGSAKPWSFGPIVLGPYRIECKVSVYRYETPERAESAIKDLRGKIGEEFH